MNNSKSNSKSKSNSYLGAKGYTILKSDISISLQNEIKDELNIKPYVSQGDAKSYAVYRESFKKLYVPRYYGLLKLGPPESNNISNGESIKLEFNGSLREKQEMVVTKYINYIENSIEVAKRVNAKWMTVVPGHLDLRKDMSYQTSNVIETLKRACDILEPHGLVMVLEPLNFRDHPGLFLTESPQAFQICKAVDSPSCKILFDIYHQQIQEGNLIPNIDDTWDEIAYFQIGDNPGRKEPTTGEINYKNVFKFIYEKGFEGILGMEHGNSIQGERGEKALVDAYLEADSF